MTASTTTRRRLPPAASLLLAAGLAASLAACSAVGSGPTGAPVPTPAPTPAPTPKPTPLPSDPGSDGMPIKVDLVNATHHKVYVDVVDQSGTVLSGVSGTPGDGATVANFTLNVENIDPTTLRLTWTDTPGDNALALYIDKTITHFVLVQPEHAGDSIPFDRILILKFSQPVSAGNIEAVLQNGTDNVG